jgi:hypothetical protein
LITISNFAGCWVGGSPGFSQARILTTYSTVARNCVGNLTRPPGGYISQRRNRTSGSQCQKSKSALAPLRPRFDSVRPIPGYFPAEEINDEEPRSTLGALRLASGSFRREYALVYGAGLSDKAVFPPLGDRPRDKLHNLAHLLTSAENSEEIFRQLSPMLALKRISCQLARARMPLSPILNCAHLMVKKLETSQLALIHTLP